MGTQFLKYEQFEQRQMIAFWRRNETHMSSLYRVLLIPIVEDKLRCMCILKLFFIYLFIYFSLSLSFFPSSMLTILPLLQPVAPVIAAGSNSLNHSN